MLLHPLLFVGKHYLNNWKKYGIRCINPFFNLLRGWIQKDAFVFIEIQMRYIMAYVFTYTF
jgi:hypothetical protein